MKTATLFLSLLLLVIYAAVPTDTLVSMGLRAGSPFSARFTYMLAHGSWLHLAINLYSMLVLSFLSGAKVWQCVVSMICGIFLPYMVLADTPIVGISTYIYCLTGIIVAGCEKWKTLFLLNVAVVFASYLFMAGNIAVFAHLWCFAVGFLAGFITTKKIVRYD